MITKSQATENTRIVGWSPKAKRYVPGTIWKSNADSCQIRDSSLELHTGLKYKNCWLVEEFQKAKPNEYARLFPGSEPLPKSEDVFSEEYLEGAIAELDPNCKNLTDEAKDEPPNPENYFTLQAFSKAWREWESRQDDEAQDELSLISPEKIWEEWELNNELNNCKNLTDALEHFGFLPSPFSAEEEREMGEFQQEYRGWQIYFFIPNDGITSCAIIWESEAYQFIVGDSPDDWEFHFDYLDGKGVLAHAKKAINAAEEFLCREQLQLNLFESAPDAVESVPASSLQPLASASNSSNSSNGLNSVSQSLNLDILESPSTETSELTEQSQTIAISGASPHPVNLSASRENDSEQATQGIVSLMSSESSESHSLPTSQLKMSQDFFPAHGSQDTEAEPTSTIFSAIYGESGTTWSGSPLAAPTLERPGLENGYLLLESPSALGTMGEGSEAGQHKLDGQLKQYGAIADGEVTAPALIEDGSGLPIGYSDPAICTTAGEFLAEMGLLGHAEKPLGTPSTGELPESHLSESFTSTASCWKIITLHQPWAWAVGRGKQFETRSWGTTYRGKLLIHAAAESNQDQAEAMALAYENIADLLPPIEDLVFGAVVALADLADCIEMTEDFINEQTETELAFGDWKPGRYAWKLENIQILEKPIPCKGKQGLRDVDPDVLVLVQEVILRSNSQSSQDKTETWGQVEPGYYWIDPKDVDIESGTQIRLLENSEKIAEYAELMREDAWDWENVSGQHPQPIVFWDKENKKYWGGDCHHRIKAAIKAEIDLVYVQVRVGTFDQAVFFNITTNVEHGVPLRPCDQRKRIEMFLPRLAAMTPDERIELLDKVPLLSDKERSLIIKSGGEWSARIIARYLRLAGGGYATVCSILKEIKFKERIEEWGIKQGARYEYKPDGSCGIIYEISVQKQRISVYWDMQWWSSRSAISSPMPLDEFLRDFTRANRLPATEQETKKPAPKTEETNTSNESPDLLEQFQQQDKRPQLLPDKPRNEGSSTALAQEDGSQPDTAELLLNQLLGQLGLLDDDQLKSLIIKAKAEQERRKQIRKAA